MSVRNDFLIDFNLMSACCSTQILSDGFKCGVGKPLIESAHNK